MRRFVGISLLFALIFLITGCKKPVMLRNADSPHHGIVCFGDSITAGYGSTEGNDYPSILKRSIPEEPVINAGKNGDTSKDGLIRLQQDVLSHKPRIVIVEFGGNDFLQKIPVEQTLANIETITEQIQQSGAAVILLEIKIHPIKDLYIAGFQRIARNKQALLLPHILKGILTNPSVKSDIIHPNDKGYQIVAERVLRAIEPYRKRE
jgi:acyl-CoA thioesterase-1